jgi:hypothetical protein
MRGKLEPQTDFIDQLYGTAKPTEPEAKAEGMEAAEQSAPDKGYDIETMRRWARWYIKANKSMRDLSISDIQRLRQSRNVVWADVVRKEFNIVPLSGRGNNFLGNFFAGDKRFIATGEFVKSKTKDSHQNKVMLWTLSEYKQ